MAISKQTIGGVSYWYASYAGSPIKLDANGKYFDAPIYFTCPSASTGTSASGSLVSTIIPSASTQYFNIGTGYSNGKYWKINPVNTESCMVYEFSQTYTPSEGYFFDSVESGDSYVCRPGIIAYINCQYDADVELTDIEEMEYPISVLYDSNDHPTVRFANDSNRQVSMDRSTGATTITNLSAGNIKNGVTIFGVTGTYSGEGSSTAIGSYTFTNRSTTYKFEYKATLGEFESTNKNINSSYAVCRLTFNIITAGQVVIEYISSGENNYDFGIFSKIDTALNLNNTEDSASLIYKNCKGEASTTKKQVVYNFTTGSHYIDIKYKKDASASTGNDSLRFWVGGPAFIDSNLVAGNIKQGTNIMGITGTASGGTIKYMRFYSGTPSDRDFINQVEFVDTMVGSTWYEYLNEGPGLTISGVGTFGTAGEGSLWGDVWIESGTYAGSYVNMASPIDDQTRSFSGGYTLMAPGDYYL